MPTVSNFLRNVREGAQALFSEELWLTVSVLFLPVLYMTAALALLSDVGLGRWVFPAGLLLWGGAVMVLHRDEKWQRLAATLLLFLAGFALAAWATSHTLDMFWDSRQYHTRSIIALLDGSNPYFDKAPWHYTYPAASWLLSASFVLWTQSFEASFAFTLVATFAAFLCVRRFLSLLEISRAWRFWLSVLFVANPSTMFRVFSFYNDGLLVAVLLSVFLLMLCFVCDNGSYKQDKRRRIRTVFGIGALLVLLINIKFTTLAYGGVLGLTALAYGIWRSASRRRLVQLAGLGAASFVLGTFVFGFYPYVTNTMQHQNPFHPAIPFDKQANAKASVIFDKYNPAFTNMSQYEQWWVSLFGKERKGERGFVLEPLPPFSSLRPSSSLRLFGSFFSGSMLLCLLLVFFVQHRGAWIVMGGVFVSVFVAGVGFVFRYAPQNWWLPLLLLVFVLAREKEKSLLSRVPSIVAVAVAVCMSLTSIMRPYTPFKDNLTHVATLRELKQQEGWYVVPDLSLKGAPQNMRKYFFNYYKSGLTGVTLPLREECPDTAERRQVFLALALCRP